MRSILVSSVAALAMTLGLAMPVAAAAKEKAPVKVDGPKYIAGLTGVTLASFNVAFVSEKTDAAFAGARNQFKAMGSITKAKLAGVTPADFQAITDAAYADFVARLTAAGFTLGDRQALIADKQMAKVQLLASGAEGKLTFGKESDANAIFYGPTAFGPTPLMKGETGTTGVAKMGGMFGAVSGLGAMGGPGVAKVYYSIYSKQPTMTVTYVIDFADVARYGGRYAVQASVEMKASLAVLETASVVTTTNDKGAQSTLTLTQPVAVPGNFGTLADTSTTGRTVDNVAGAVIGGLFGVGTNRYTDVTFTADPAAYRAGATQAAISANQTIIAELMARR